MTYRVVGWLLHSDNLCERCHRNPAAVIVYQDENPYLLDTTELCRDCLPDGHVDSIAEVLRRDR